MKARTLYKVGAAGVATILAVAALIVIPRINAAGTATLTLSPTSGSYYKGSTFTVTVYEDSGSSTINAVEADLAYSTSGLQFVSLNADPPASDFGVKAEASGGSGSATFQLGNIGALSGKHQVGTLTFKVLGGSGSTSINFKSSSALLTNDQTPVNVWDGNTAAAATYTLKTQSTTTTGGTTTKKTTTSTSTSTKAASTGSITPSQSAQNANPAAPVPVSKVSNTVGTYLVNIKVVDGSGKPVSGATVTLGVSTTNTDSTGIAGFANIPAGVYNVSVKDGNNVGKSTITVDGTQPVNSLQQFEITAKPKYNLALYGGIAAGVVILIIILVAWGGGGMSPRMFKSGPAAGGHDNLPNSLPKVSTGPAPTANNANAQKDNLIKPTVITPSGPTSSA